MWLTIALIGYAGMAVVSILDKFIISNEKVLPSVFVYYSTIYLLPLNFGLFIIPVLPTFRLEMISIFSAITFTLGLWTMYRAMQKSEISHIGPFIGGLIPLIILILSQFFLTENISPIQLAGILLLSLGTFVISFQDIGSDWKSGVMWAVASVLSFSMSHVASKYVYDQIGFSTGLVLIWGFMGVIGVLLLIFVMPVREIVFPRKNIISHLADKFAAHKKKNKSLALVVADKSLSAVGIFMIQYSVSLGSVTKVYALAGVQYGLLVVLVALLTKFAPKYFNESYEEGEMKKELIAVGIIALGLALLV
jgi:drug/metabolite transporter (DMT)-like permease